MLLITILFILGLVIIIKGGDLFVDSAVWFAKVTGMPNILIGATIVSLATTLPELFVSTIATLQGAPDVAIGNAVGSTICNIGIILALSMIFMPGKVNKSSVKLKGLLMIFGTIMVMFLSIDKVMYLSEGLVLLAILGVYIYINILEVKSSKKEILTEAAVEVVVEKDRKAVITNVGQFIIGALFIVLGARLLVDNGIKIADFFKVPQSIVSLTLIALGTSLPELITTVTAIIKKHEDISIGNIIGANILNVTMILGTSAVVAPNGLALTTRTINIFNNILTIPQTLMVDIPVSLILMIVVVIPTMLSGKLKRWQGFTVLSIYIGYLIFLATSL